MDKHITQDELDRTLDEMDATSRLLYLQARDQGLLDRNMLAAHRQGYQLALDSLRYKFGMGRDTAQSAH